MSSISIFDIFKIGIGPSSSHTLGPWNAAALFAKHLEGDSFDTIKIHLYGSLSKTGVGHATDKAVMFGLMGHTPKKVDTSQLDTIIKEVEDSGHMTVSNKTICFDIIKDIVFENTEHDLHPNTLKFAAYQGNKLIKEQIFASTGGGFISYDEPKTNTDSYNALPCPITSGSDLLRYTRKQQCKISDIVSQNELALQSQEEIDLQIQSLLDTMIDSMYVGCKTEGVLPGGLNVKRRAKSLCDTLLNGASYTHRSEWMSLVKNTPKDFNSVNKWVSCFALAVNEHNAAMGRIVTSPTNGAAGVIPAVFMYYLLFCDIKGKERIKEFLFTAGEIGCLFVKGATISAAVGGCQAEIGVSSAMAAGALTEVLGGTPEQCLMAAEIAMEHHLGLTCDPVKGLVQVPCIERNAMGAMKAITASNLALVSDTNHAIISLDAVIKTMWEVAQDMNSKYKETSEGGLAINLPVINPYC